MSEITLPAFLANNLRQSAKSLQRAFEKMPDERLDWSPSAEGNPARCALEQVLECAYMNGWAANVFQGKGSASFDTEDYAAQTSARREKAQALDWLRENTETLASAVEASSAAKLSESIPHPFSGQPSTWADVLNLTYWNMAYHDGQINYIQVLYGDKS